MSRARPLYLDCDTGIDDALAIAALLGSPAVDLVAVGTVCGNTSAEQAAENSSRMLALAGRHRIPVALGESQPLRGGFGGGWPHVHGDNGIGGVVLPDASGAISAESAPEMMARLAEEHRGRLEILAIGPLTNLARALEIDPRLPRKVRCITIMGGAVWVPGNVTPLAEANIHVDPEAAEVVLAADWNVTLVPLDVTMHHWFDVAHQAELASSRHPAARALASMLDCYLDFHEGAYGIRRIALHDPLAAVIAAGRVPRMTIRRTGLRVRLEGEERGRTVPVSRGRSTRVVRAVRRPMDRLILRRVLTGAEVVGGRPGASSAVVASGSLGTPRSPSVS